MDFVVIGRDGKDSEAINRRMAVRGNHLELGEVMRAKGQLLCASALLDEKEKMIGSVMVMSFATRNELDDWLKIEPYQTGKVWEEVEVFPARLAPWFKQA